MFTAGVITLVLGALATLGSTFGMVATRNYTFMVAGGLSIVLVLVGAFLMTSAS